MENLKCPYCGENEALLYLVQGTDASYTEDRDEIAEIWECGNCWKLLKVYYKIERIVKLIEEE